MPHFAYKLIYSEIYRVCLIYVFENCSREQFLKTQKVFSKYCSCYLNLVFFVFSVVFRAKNNCQPNMFSLFSLFF